MADNILFTNAASKDGNEQNFICSWNFGDSEDRSINIGTSVSHRYSALGKYRVVETITSDYLPYRVVEPPVTIYVKGAKRPEAYGLTVTAASRTQISLRWSGRATTSYNVVRRTSDGVFAVAGTTHAARFTDKHVEAGTAYTYYIVSVGSGGLGTQSNTTSVSAGKPHAPTFTIAGPDEGVAVQPFNGPVSSPITITPINRFAGPVRLSVAVIDKNGHAVLSVTASLSPATFELGSAARIVNLAVNALNDKVCGNVNAIITCVSGRITKKITVSCYVPPAFQLASFTDPVNVIIGDPAGRSWKVGIIPSDWLVGKVKLTVTTTPDVPTGPQVNAALSSEFVTKNSPEATLTLTALPGTRPGMLHMVICGTDKWGNKDVLKLDNYAQTAHFDVMSALDNNVHFVSDSMDYNTIVVAPINGFTGPVSLTVTSIIDPNGKPVSNLSDWAHFESSSGLSSQGITIPGKLMDNLELTPPPSEPEGIYTVTVTGTDNKGDTALVTFGRKEDEENFFSLKADTTELTACSGDTADVEISAFSVFNEKEAIPLHYAVLDSSFRPVSGISVSFSDPLTSNSSTTATLTFAPTLADGCYQVRFIPTDSSSDSSTASTFVTIDNNKFDFNFFGSFDCDAGAPPVQCDMIAKSDDPLTGPVHLTIKPVDTGRGVNPVKAVLTSSNVTLPGNNSDTITITVPAGTPAGSYDFLLTEKADNGKKATKIFSFDVGIGFDLKSLKPNLFAQPGGTDSFEIAAPALGSGSNNLVLSAGMSPNNGAELADGISSVSFSPPYVGIGLPSKSVGTVRIAKSVPPGTEYVLYVSGTDKDGDNTLVKMHVMVAKEPFKVLPSCRTVYISRDTTKAYETITVHPVGKLSGNVRMSVVITGQNGAPAPRGLTSSFPSLLSADDQDELTFNGAFSADRSVPLGKYLAKIKFTFDKFTLYSSIVLIVSPLSLTITDDSAKPLTSGNYGALVDHLTAVLSTGKKRGQKVFYSWSLGPVWLADSRWPYNFTIDTTHWSYDWDNSKGNVISSPTTPNALLAVDFSHEGEYSIMATCTVTVVNGKERQMFSASTYAGGPPNDNQAFDN
jgi:hypothetical protein